VDLSTSWQNGAAYERFMGRWSKLVGSKFLKWLDIAPACHWLDVGCGTGSLTRLTLEGCRPQAINAVDASRDFIAYAQSLINSPSVHFQVGLAEALGLKTNSVDAAISGLVLNFVSHPESALLEMMRVVKPGGSVGVFLWDYAGGMQMLRYFWDAAVERDPRAREQDEGLRFPLCREGQLEALLRKLGLKRVETTAIEVQTVFQNLDDYWQPFLGNVGSAPVYVASLAPKDRQQLKDRLSQSLPVDAQGTISLLARAWAVKGSV
jgi:SAM-dependent methyltransferase